MTQDQTRQLGIEFERRIQTLFPDTVINKLDSDTIYSFLSEYQMQYVKLLILAKDSLEESKQSKTIDESLRPLVKQTIIGTPTFEENIDPFNKCFELPNDFLAYIRSNSLIDTNYKSEHKSLKWQHVGNKFISHENMIKAIDSFYDKNKIIRNPIVTIENATIKLIHDNYTHLDGIALTYYKMPNRFNVLKYNNKDENATHNYCDLPFSCFDELVQGAVNLYMQYRGANKPTNNKEDEK